MTHAIRRMQTATAALALASSVMASGDQAPTIRDTAWVLTALPHRTLVATVTATLRFETDRVSGSDGCNRFTAPYSSSGMSLQIGLRAASTQMACPDPVAVQAEAFMSALTNTRGYRHEAGHLQLLGDDGSVLATLAAQLTALAGTGWRVTGYNNGKQAVVSVLADTTLSATFSADGRVSGSAGCNAYTAGYATSGTSLTISPAAATRRMCAKPERVMEQEQQFLTALGTVASFRLEGERLELRNATGALALILRRETAGK